MPIGGGGGYSPPPAAPPPGYATEYFYVRITVSMLRLLAYIYRLTRNYLSKPEGMQQALG